MLSLDQNTRGNNQGLELRGKINLSSTVKSLGVILQELLDWQGCINSLLIKLNRTVGLLSKIRYYVPNLLLRTNYFSIFNLHLIYTCKIWDQRENKIKRLSEIQDKVICVICFKDKNYLTNELYYNNKILKIADYIKLLNCLFIKTILSNNQLPICDFFSKKASETHSYSTRHAIPNSVFQPQPQTD